MPPRYARMTRAEFKRVILEALEELPPEFRQALDNIDIQVRWRPTPDELRSARVRPGGDLFGIYQGVPITRRSHFDSLRPPDIIIIYQRTHELYCKTHERMVEQARQTLIHEIGHYMGIDERRLRDLGVG